MTSRKEAKERESPLQILVSEEFSDVELIGKIADGDFRAFEELMSRNLLPVVRFATRLLNDAHEAEDVAQESFLKLWDHASSYNPEKAKFTTWFYRIVSNLCIDTLRKKKTQGIKTPLEEAEIISEVESQTRSLEVDDLVKRVDEALALLPERQRLALVLCHFQGLKMQDAGDIMDISVEAIESLLARARRKLKQDLKNEWKELLPE